jgi:hypothetical protein
MITIIIYVILYLICAFLTWLGITDGKNEYPDYKNEPVTFWGYVIIFNPFNFLIVIGFIIWLIYDVHKGEKKEKK